MAKKVPVKKDSLEDIKEATARAKYMRISPRKARAVIDLIRGKNLPEAEAILRFTVHKGSKIIGKILQSAAANAEHNFEMDREQLYVKAAYVDGGPVIKRMMPRAQGRGDIIKKRTSHITIIMGER
ncbi:MAG: 50S ribosomal protein L22 [Peptococcaceae bacterium]|jgi:large subunit ribosomal protein L22|nr:50S ribosomal protein L22 [Peptococcaceae bacterium]